MHSRRVLVIEDDSAIRETAVEILADHGYDVISATNGENALAVLRSGVQLPCLILLDLMMPVMDGREFRRMQALDRVLSEIPTVIMSAHSTAADEAKELKADDYLGKPMKMSALLQVVARFCSVE